MLQSFDSSNGGTADTASAFALLGAVWSSVSSAADSRSWSGTSRTSSYARTDEPARPAAERLLGRRPWAWPSYRFCLERPEAISPDGWLDRRLAAT